MYPDSKACEQLDYLVQTVGLAKKLRNRESFSHYLQAYAIVRCDCLEFGCDAGGDAGADAFVLDHKGRLAHDLYGSLVMHSLLQSFLLLMLQLAVILSIFFSYLTPV